ncbi:MAG: GTP-binding protein [Alphaproteobacteria bacterium]|nr:GTP-binding protein [Alphaproteobacteria bacterium]
MRIKTYIAQSVPEAMNKIRQDFGNGAVILSNHRTLEGVRITVGLEDNDVETQIQDALFGSPIDQRAEKIQKALLSVGVPALLVERILDALPSIMDESETVSLTKALDKVFQFDPLPVNSTKRAFMLVGACGCGKTIVTAKMAVKAKISGKKVAVITTDVKRAGAIEQLEAFTKILDLDLIKVRKPDLLRNVVEENRTNSDLILIDTPGINPFLSTDINLLKDMLNDTQGIEPVLVMSAGMDATESEEIGGIFQKLGCHRLLGTRLDLSRRLGNLLWTAQSNGYALTDVGVSPHVSEGLCPLKAKSLAELLLLENKKGVV